MTIVLWLMAVAVAFLVGAVVGIWWWEADAAQRADEAAERDRAAQRPEPWSYRP